MTRSSRPHTSHLLAAASLSLALLSACKHDCESTGGEIPGDLTKADAVAPGGTYCGDFNHDAKAAARVYYPNDVVETTLAFQVHLGGKGWTRVACNGDTLSATPDAGGSSECFTKGDEVVYVSTYQFGHHALGVIPRPGSGALVELDPADPTKRP